MSRSVTSKYVQEVRKRDEGTVAYTQSMSILGLRVMDRMFNYSESGSVDCARLQVWGDKRKEEKVLNVHPRPQSKETIGRETEIEESVSK